MQVRYRRRGAPPLRPAGLALAGMLLAGCEPAAATTSPDGAVRPVYCTVMADPVHRDAAGRLIVAPAHFRCDRPGPDTLRLAVALQHRVGETWITLQAQEFTARGVETTRARSERSRVRTVAAPCAGGVYRSLVQALGRTGTVQTRYGMNGLAVTDPCERTSLG